MHWCRPLACVRACVRVCICVRACVSKKHTHQTLFVQYTSFYPQPWQKQQQNNKLSNTPASTKCQPQTLTYAKTAHLGCYGATVTTNNQPTTIQPTHQTSKQNTLATMVPLSQPTNQPTNNHSANTQDQQAEYIGYHGAIVTTNQPTNQPPFSQHTIPASRIHWLPWCHCHNQPTNHSANTPGQQAEHLGCHGATVTTNQPTHQASKQNTLATMVPLSQPTNQHTRPASRTPWLPWCHCHNQPTTIQPTHQTSKQNTLATMVPLLQPTDQHTRPASRTPWLPWWYCHNQQTNTPAQRAEHHQLHQDSSSTLSEAAVTKQDDIYSSFIGAGIAQLVQRPTEKPSVILMRVRVPGAGSDFLPRVNFRCRLSYGVRAALVCNRMHQHLFAHVKYPQHWQPQHRSDVYTKIRLIDDRFL